jgi:hypothetical protein
MAEEVIHKDGKYEIDPARMTEVVRQQRMNEAERDRIIHNRHQFLAWMHDHFADGVAHPPEGADD